MHRDLAVVAVPGAGRESVPIEVKAVVQDTVAVVIDSVAKLTHRRVPRGVGVGTVARTGGVAVVVPIPSLVDQCVTVLVVAVADLGRRGVHCGVRVVAVQRRACKTVAEAVAVVIGVAADTADVGPAAILVDPVFADVLLLWGEPGVEVVAVQLWTAEVVAPAIPIPVGLPAGTGIVAGPWRPEVPVEPGDRHRTAAPLVHRVVGGRIGIARRRIQRQAVPGQPGRHDGAVQVHPVDLRAEKREDDLVLQVEAERRKLRRCHDAAVAANVEVAGQHDAALGRHLHGCREDEAVRAIVMELESEEIDGVIAGVPDLNPLASGVGHSHWIEMDFGDDKVARLGQEGRGRRGPGSWVQPIVATDRAGPRLAELAFQGRDRRRTGPGGRRDPVDQPLHVITHGVPVGVDRRRCPLTREAVVQAGHRGGGQDDSRHAGRAVLDLDRRRGRARPVLGAVPGRQGAAHKLASGERRPIQGRGRSGRLPVHRPGDRIGLGIQVGIVPPDPDARQDRGLHRRKRTDLRVGDAGGGVLDEDLVPADRTLLNPVVGNHLAAPGLSGRSVRRGQGRCVPQGRQAVA